MNICLNIALYIGSGDKSIIETISSFENRSIIKMIVVVIAGSGLLIPFSQFMNKRMYKQHLDELRPVGRNLKKMRIINICNN